MSVFYGVRLTDEISARIEATGRGKSAVIQAALDAYFEGKYPQVEKPKAEQMIIEKREIPKFVREKKGKPHGDHHAIGDDKPIVREIESAREAEEPAVSGGCRKHPDSGGFPKAGGWWCPQCGKIV